MLSLHLPYSSALPIIHSIINYVDKHNSYLHNLQTVGGLGGGATAVILDLRPLLSPNLLNEPLYG